MMAADSPTCSLQTDGAKPAYLSDGCTLTHRSFRSAIVAILRFDLIYYYKVLGNLTALNLNDYFIIHRTNPASQFYPIYLLRPPNGTNRHSSSFFFYRNTNVFSDLPHDLKSATTLASFKNGLNSLDFSKYLKVSAFG